MEFKTWLESSTLDLLVSYILKRHPGLELSAYETSNKIELTSIEVPEEFRGSGIGTKIVRELQDYARSVAKPIVIRPEAERGRKGDLERFYKSLGFVHNKGRNTNFILSSPTSRTMYWTPVNEKYAGQHEPPGRVPSSHGNITEARTPKVIMYHGTAVRNLRSIMSHGLLPSPRGRAWADDPDSSFHSASRASLDGVYLTRNLMTALSAASNGANRKYMKEGDLLIAVEMQPKTAFADEDDLNFMATISNMEMEVADLYYSLEKGGEMRRFDAAKDKYRDRFFSRLGSEIKIHTRAMERLGPMVDLVFDAALKRQAAYVERYIKNYFKDLKVPDKSQSEKDFMRAREALTRTLKSLANPFNHEGEPFNLTARVEEPIGFRGTNKIVCVMVVPFDYKEKPRLIYGYVPDDLLRQWEERKGEWRGVEK